MKKFLVISCVVVFLTGCGAQPESKAPASSKAKAVPQKVNYAEVAIQKLQSGDIASAIKSFDEAIKQNPGNPDPYILLSQTYMRLQEYSRALDTLAAASRISPNRGDIYYLIAVNHGLTGQNDLAKISAQRSVELFQQAQDEENFKKALALLQGLLQTE